MQELAESPGRSAQQQGLKQALPPAAYPGQPRGAAGRRYNELDCAASAPAHPGRQAGGPPSSSGSADSCDLEAGPRAAAARAAGHVSSWADALAEAATAPALPDTGASSEVRHAPRADAAHAEHGDGLSWGSGDYLSASRGACRPAQAAPSLAAWLRPLIARGMAVRPPGRQAPGSAGILEGLLAGASASPAAPAGAPGSAAVRATAEAEPLVSPRIGTGWGAPASPRGSRPGGCGYASKHPEPHADAAAQRGMAMEGYGHAGLGSGCAGRAWWARACPGKWCERCGAWQHLRARHCLACERCVLTYDHHCIWAGAPCYLSSQKRRWP